MSKFNVMETGKKKDYGTICLPKKMIEEIKLWRKAYMVCYPQKDISYESMIRGMLDCLEPYEPDVYAEFSKMYASLHPEEFEQEEN